MNNWLHSLFSQVDVYLNDTLVTPSSNTYPFRAYVDTVLNGVSVKMAGGQNPDYKVHMVDAVLFARKAV